jgi:hypothetical protein
VIRSAEVSKRRCRLLRRRLLLLRLLLLRRLPVPDLQLTVQESSSLISRQWKHNLTTAADLVRCPELKHRHGRLDRRRVRRRRLDHRRLMRDLRTRVRVSVKDLDQAVGAEEEDGKDEDQVQLVIEVKDEKESHIKTKNLTLKRLPPSAAQSWTTAVAASTSAASSSVIRIPFRTSSVNSMPSGKVFTMVFAVARSPWSGTGSTTCGKVGQRPVVLASVLRHTRARLLQLEGPDRVGGEAGGSDALGPVHETRIRERGARRGCGPARLT